MRPQHPQHPQHQALKSACHLVQLYPQCQLTNAQIWEEFGCNAMFCRSSFVTQRRVLQQTFLKPRALWQTRISCPIESSRQVLQVLPRRREVQVLVTPRAVPAVPRATERAGQQDLCVRRECDKCDILSFCQVWQRSGNPWRYIGRRWDNVQCAHMRLLGPSPAAQASARFQPFQGQPSGVFVQCACIGRHMRTILQPHAGNAPGGISSSWSNWIDSEQ